MSIGAFSTFVSALRSKMTAPVAQMAAIGMLMKKIQCQPQLSEIVPPRMGPKIGATIVVIAQIPVACACFSLGKMRRSKVWLIGISGPPHNPCPIRNATREPRLHAIPHSKENTPAEILEFCRAWPGQVPLVLVPTAYPQLSFAEVAALRKVGLIICANHAIRAAVAAMRAAFARILAEGGIAGVESSIASVADIFALQGDARMRELEARFLR